MVGFSVDRQFGGLFFTLTLPTGVEFTSFIVIELPDWLHDDFLVPTGVGIDESTFTAFVDLADVPDIDDLRAAINDLQQRVDGLVDEAVAQARQLVNDARADLQRAIDSAVADVRQFVDRRLGDLDESVASAIADVRQAIKSARQDLSQSIDSAVADLRGLVRSARRDLSQAITSAVNGVETAIMSTLRPIIEDVQQAIDSVSKDVEQLRRDILAAIPNGLLEDPTRWAFTAVLEEAEQNLEAVVIPFVKRLTEATLQIVLTADTKQDLRDVGGEE